MPHSVQSCERNDILSASIGIKKVRSSQVLPHLINWSPQRATTSEFLGVSLLVWSVCHSLPRNGYPSKSTPRSDRTSLACLEGLPGEGLFSLKIIWQHGLVCKVAFEQSTKPLERCTDEAKVKVFGHEARGHAWVLSEVLPSCSPHSHL